MSQFPGSYQDPISAYHAQNRALMDQTAAMLARNAQMLQTAVPYNSTYSNVAPFTSPNMFSQISGAVGGLLGPEVGGIMQLAAPLITNPSLAPYLGPLPGMVTAMQATMPLGGGGDPGAFLYSQLQRRLGKAIPGYSLPTSFGNMAELDIFNEQMQQYAAFTGGPAPVDQLQTVDTSIGDASSAYGMGVQLRNIRTLAQSTRFKGAFDLYEAATDTKVTDDRLNALIEAAERGDAIAAEQEILDPAVKELAKKVISNAERAAGFTNFALNANRMIPQIAQMLGGDAATASALGSIGEALLDLSGLSRDPTLFTSAAIQSLSSMGALGMMTSGVDALGRPVMAADRVAAGVLRNIENAEGPFTGLQNIGMQRTGQIMQELSRSGMLTSGGVDVFGAVTPDDIKKMESDISLQLEAFSEVSAVGKRLGLHVNELTSSMQRVYGGRFAQALSEEAGRTFNQLQQNFVGSTGDQTTEAGRTFNQPQMEGPTAEAGRISNQPQINAQTAEGGRAPNQPQINAQTTEAGRISNQAQIDAQTTEAGIAPNQPQINAQTTEGGRASNRLQMDDQTREFLKAEAQRKAAATILQQVESAVQIGRFAGLDARGSMAVVETSAQLAETLGLSGGAGLAMGSAAMGRVALSRSMGVPVTFEQAMAQQQDIMAKAKQNPSAKAYAALKLAVNAGILQEGDATVTDLMKRFNAGEDISLEQVSSMIGATGANVSRFVSDEAISSGMSLMGVAQDINKFYATNEGVSLIGSLKRAFRSSGVDSDALIADIVRKNEVATIADALKISKAEVQTMDFLQFATAYNKLGSQAERTAALETLGVDPTTRSIIASYLGERMNSFGLAGDRGTQKTAKVRLEEEAQRAKFGGITSVEATATATAQAQADISNILRAKKGNFRQGVSTALESIREDKINKLMEGNGGDRAAAERAVDREGFTMVELIEVASGTSSGELNEALSTAKEQAQKELEAAKKAGDLAGQTIAERKRKQLEDIEAVRTAATPEEKAKKKQEVLDKFEEQRAAEEASKTQAQKDAAQQQEDQTKANQAIPSIKTDTASLAETVKSLQEVLSGINQTLQQLASRVLGGG